MGSGARTRYNVTIDGRGFMLRGSPQNPAYRKASVGMDLSSISPDDPAYNPLNGSDWSYWAQTDWSGGFQAQKFKDDATYLNSQAVDVSTKRGEVRLQRLLAANGLPISGSYVNLGGVGEQNSNLVFGLSKSGSSRLYRSTKGTVAIISSIAGISAIEDISPYKGKSLVGMTRVSGTLKTLAWYDGTTLSAFRSTNPTVRAVGNVGLRAYTAERVPSLSCDVLYYSTDLATFTSAFQTGSSSAKIKKIVNLNGIPYLLMEEGNTVSLFRFDEYQSVPFLVHRFADLDDWGVTIRLSEMIISGKENGTPVVFAFDGSVLREIFRDSLDRATSCDFSRPFVFDGYLHLHGARWDGEAWFPGLYGTRSSIGYGQVKPLANAANFAYAYAISGTSRFQLFCMENSINFNSGHVIASDFGHSLGHVDKLVNSVRINCDPLASGQSISIDRSTDGGASYTQVGTVSYASDGAVSGKTIYFPSGFITRKWLYRARLVDSTTVSGATGPVLKDVVHQYRTVPDQRRRWSMALQARDGIGLLNGQEEQRSGHELAAELWNLAAKKSPVVLEDLDYFSASFTAPMSKTATSAAVSETNFMPRRGRLRAVVSGVAEEMTYTTADGKKILGITRAQRGTIARAYTTSHRLDSAYTVVLTDVDQMVDTTDEGKTESTVRVGMLEV